MGSTTSGLGRDCNQPLLAVGRTGQAPRDWRQNALWALCGELALPRFRRAATCQRSDGRGRDAILMGPCKALEE